MVSIERAEWEPRNRRQFRTRGYRALPNIPLLSHPCGLPTSAESPGGVRWREAPRESLHFPRSSRSASARILNASCPAALHHAHPDARRRARSWFFTLGSLQAAPDIPGITRCAARSPIDSEHRSRHIRAPWRVRHRRLRVATQWYKRCEHG